MGIHMMIHYNCTIGSFLLHSFFSKKECNKKLPIVQVIICIPVHAYIIFSCLYDAFWVKNDIGTGIHMIIHYNCTIGSFLLHSFLLIYRPYPPSFHEMIFTLVPLFFSYTKNANTARAYIAYACALAQTAPLLSKRLVTRQWRLFEESVGCL